MAFTAWGYSFEGTWKDPNRLEPRSGVYVIWDISGDNWTVLDVGESHDVLNRVLTHDWQDCWKQHCKGAFTIQPPIRRICSRLVGWRLNRESET